MQRVQRKIARHVPGFNHTFASSDGYPAAPSVQGGDSAILISQVFVVCAFSYIVSICFFFNTPSLRS